MAHLKLKALIFFAAVIWSLFSYSGNVFAQSTNSGKETLNVVTIERKPFSIKNGDEYSGFSIDLWREISLETNRDYRFISASSFPEMLAMVEDGKVDLAIANISITSKREMVLDFSHPIFDAGLQVMVPEQGGSFGMLYALFDWTMLIWVAGAIVSLIVIAQIMWFFERKHQSYFQVSYFEGLWPSFWWALNTIVNGGFEERSPRTFAGRLFGTILVIASLFVVSIFVAKITSIMTVNELQSQIQSYKDLYGRRVWTTKGSTAEAFLKEHSIPYQSTQNFQELLDGLKAGEIDAVVHDAPLLAFRANTDGRGYVRVVGPILKPEKYGIALQQNSPLTEAINRALLKIHETGAYDRIFNKWFGSS